MLYSFCLFLSTHTHTHTHTNNLLFCRICFYICGVKIGNISLGISLCIYSVIKLFRWTELCYRLRLSTLLCYVFLLSVPQTKVCVYIGPMTACWSLFSASTHYVLEIELCQDGSKDSHSPSLNWDTSVPL